MKIKKLELRNLLSIIFVLSFIVNRVFKICPEINNFLIFGFVLTLVVPVIEKQNPFKTRLRN